MPPASICFVNATRLLRRPISELIQQQEGKRRIGLLITSRAVQHEQELHHTRPFEHAEVLTYRSWQLPGPFEWPIPSPGFIPNAWRALTQYDIVHIWAHFYPSTLILLLLSLMTRTKIILTMDTIPGYSFSLGRTLDTLFKIYTWTIGRIVYGIPDRITLYGKSLLPHARRSGINMRKVSVIPTGIMSHKLPDRTSARKAIQNDLKLGESPIVLYAGLINPRKRVGDVLAVARQLPEATFLIAGDGPEKDRLEKEALENVRFLGWRKDIIRLLRASDCLLFPSSAEGLPGIVMEAMLIGTPIITTRIPCSTDLISHNQDGLLCKVGDKKCMKESLVKVLHNAKLRKAITNSAKKKIESHFSWVTIIQQYEQIYDE